MNIRVELNREEEAIHDVLIKLCDERLLAEDWNVVVNASDSFYKAVIIDTADKIRHKAASNLGINAGKDELKEV